MGGVKDATGDLWRGVSGTLLVGCGVVGRWWEKAFGKGERFVSAGHAGRKNSRDATQRVPTSRARCFGDGTGAGRVASAAGSETRAPWGAGHSERPVGWWGAIIVRDRGGEGVYAPAVVLNFYCFAFYENFASACLRLGDGRWACVMYG